MQNSKHTAFLTVRSEGTILPNDLLQRIVSGDTTLPGLTPESYHLLKSEKLNEAINRSWNRLLGAWASFQGALERLPAAESTTSVTRERWLLVLFQELGYGRLVTSKALVVDERSYPISHLWQHTPIHLLGWHVDLDVRTAGVAGAAHRTPHSLVQEVLNRSDQHLWGLLSNGHRLRVLRDNASLTRLSYVEFDLAAMMAGEVYADFVLLWLLCHQSRVEAERPESCLLEQWSRAADAEGIRALDALRRGVEEAIKALGRGLLAHPANHILREQLRSGDLSNQDFYRQLLRMVYRLLFLLVAEDREVLLDPEADETAHTRYTRFYSVGRLRDLAERRRGTRHTDLFAALKLVIHHLGHQGYRPLGLPALGSQLFSPDFTAALNDCALANEQLLDAMRALAFIHDRHGRRLVDYRHLGAEELGSVYEALLELHPQVNQSAATFELQAAGGSERKTTGSYYTPTSLIARLLDSALDPVIEERLQQAGSAAEEVLLSLKICDPACGSGHFLLAAANRVAKHLAAIRTGDEEPSPEAVRTARRDVIGRCIYGVDSNPMAVELCKVNLWIEALEPGKPLTFLDHHIQCGNSLLGATPSLLADGIPDVAFKPIEGDDKAVCSAYRKQNKKERTGQLSMFDPTGQPWERLGDLAVSLTAMDAIADDQIEGIHARQELYEKHVRSSGYLFGRLWADAWCAAFVWQKTRAFDYPITEQLFRKIERNPHDLAPWMRDEIRRLAEQYQFFHWHIAFPDVFWVEWGKVNGGVGNSKSDELAEHDPGWQGGFDVVLGNPPWERFTISEEEWFASRDSNIASVSGKARRNKLITELIDTNPYLYESWMLALRDAALYHHILSNKTKLYPLTGSGELNTYHLFAELTDRIVSRQGRTGIIVKTGIASANNCLPFFKKLTDQQQIISLFDFVNTKKLFPDVQTVERFSLLTFSGKDRKNTSSTFATLCQEVDDLSQPDRQYTLLSTDIRLMSPINGACPLLKNARDAEIMRNIYRKFPILGFGDLTQPGKSWNVTYVSIFHMANDSGNFYRREDLESAGLVMNAQRYFVSSDETYLPLYEGKYVYLMDHRYGSFEDVPMAKRYGRKATAPTPAEDQLCDPYYEIIPRYWFPESLWLERCQTKNLRSDFQFHCRDVTGVYPHIRTAIGAICSSGPAGHKLPALILSSFGEQHTDVQRYLAFAALFCSIPFDYIVRNKLFSNSLTWNTLSQIPMPPPEQVLHTSDDRHSLKSLLQKLALELSFTSWSLMSLGEGAGYTRPFVWNQERRYLILREIDALSAHFFGLSYEEFDYVLSTFETLASQEMKYYGAFKTKELALDRYTAIQEAQQNDMAYETRLDPPPADPRVAHGTGDDGSY